MSYWLCMHFISIMTDSNLQTVFPAPLGPTRTVRGLKKVITCLSLSSTPKLLTPRILIFSILDILDQVP